MRPPLSPSDEALVDLLSSRKPSELLPILLEVARRQSARRTPRDLLARYSRDAFVAPSMVDQRSTLRFDAAALEAAAGFEALLLSPLTPQGTCSVVSPTTQDRSVTTPRSTEVVSDPTNVLALECARRLLAGERHVRLCTVHQVVRPQRFERKPGHSQHFRMFALGEAGIARGEHGFEVDAVVAHAKVFLRIFELCESIGCRLPSRRARLLLAPEGQPAGERIERRLAGELPDLPVEIATLESSYYDGIRLLIDAEMEPGQYVNLGDVGVFDWMAKLTSNGRMRFVAAGFGLQLLRLLFYPPSQATALRT